MADIRFKSNHIEHGVLRTVWEGLGTVAATDVGLPENLDRYPVHSVQFGGTFGGATVVLEGSDDGVTYFTLTGENPVGGADTLVTATSATRFDILHVVPHFIRPRISGGGLTTDITVTMTSKVYGN